MSSSHCFLFWDDSAIREMQRVILFASPPPAVVVDRTDLSLSAPSFALLSSISGRKGYSVFSGDFASLRLLRVSIGLDQTTTVWSSLFESSSASSRNIDGLSITTELARWCFCLRRASLYFRDSFQLLRSFCPICTAFVVLAKIWSAS